MKTTEARPSKTLSSAVEPGTRSRRHVEEVLARIIAKRRADQKALALDELDSGNTDNHK